MVIKINYTSSDIYVSTSVSPVYVIVGNGGSNGSAVWGQITGTLSNQTDLQNALNAKFDDPTGTTAQYLRGDGSLATFPTITNGTVTSVDMSVPTGLTISGNPITSSGTLAVGLASGYSIPTTASQATWNTAYNDSIVSAGVTGTTTKTLTLNQQDGGTVTASWSDIDTGLTSVGLSMPVAFSVANTPLTSNGTLAVSAAGTSAQYIRGDGQLANFPTNGGGGSSVNYYLNGSVSQGTFGGDTYYEMSKTPILGVGTDFTRTNAQGNGYIASFITDAGDPSLLSIPGGNWNLEFYFNASSSGSTPQFYGEIYKVDASNNFTLIASASANPETISSGTIVDQYFTSIPVPQTSLLSTDRLAVRIYVIPSGRTITLHTENSNLCEVLTTFSTGLNALNGLTAQVQYFATGTTGTDFAISSVTDTHTFNLPTASATNRGALSSADWSTFSGKVGGSGSTGQVAYWNGTSSQTGSNNLFWDAANARLGIGTTTPSAYTHIKNTGLVNQTIETTSTSGRTISKFASPDTYLDVRVHGSTYTGDTWFGVNSAQTSVMFTQYGHLLIGTYDSKNLYLGTNNATRAVITAAGRLLLGTTTEGTYLLDVNGTARVSGAYTNQSDVGLVVSASIPGINLRTPSAGRFSIISNYTATNRTSFLVGTGTSNPTFEALYIDHSTGASVFQGSVTASSLIKSGGTSSQYLMADGSTSTLTNPVTGTGTTNYLPKWTSSSALGNSLVYDNGTNVLINTTSDSGQKLQVNGTIKADGRIFINAGNGNQLYLNNAGERYTQITFDNNSTSISQAYLAWDSVANFFEMYAKTGGGLKFYANQSEAMIITTSSFVGIGTSTPSYKLDVNRSSLGTIAQFITLDGTYNPRLLISGTSEGIQLFATYSSGGAEALMFGTANSEKMRLTSNLLIGSTVDSGERLQVTGSAKITGDVNISGVFRETLTTNRQTASYTLALADNGKLVEMNVATANNLTVPLNSSVTFPIGTKIDIAQYGAGQTTIVATSGVTVRSAGGALKLTVQYSGGSLVKIGTDEWYLFGDITV